ncbi:hypothetical protein PSEHALCIP103_01075 [Pseudoalteromonas haloplanktis]|uniref:Uncharacterized protein n=1 Tax=Pseudoalteromonas haloplanktis TaxID=228 RepID=A0A9W4QV59_PSEHA|nr:hypothetical protein PSEHALCIP103_01075 [Pseudoalteromonas haloplanktis]
MGLLALFQDYKLLYLKQKSITHTSYAFLINLKPIHFTNEYRRLSLLHGQ